MQWTLFVHDLLNFLQCIFVPEESNVTNYWLRRLDHVILYDLLMLFGYIMCIPGLKSFRICVEF